MVLLDIIGVQDRNMFVLAVFGVTLRFGTKLSYERCVDITGAKSSEVCTHTVHTQTALSAQYQHTQTTHITQTQTHSKQTHPLIVYMEFDLLCMVIVCGRVSRGQKVGVNPDWGK